jgi:CRP-like cAMP-binding protein
MELLERNLREISPLSTEIMLAFICKWKRWEVPAGHMLLREHTISDYIYFIEEGIARIYYHKHDKVITEWIAMNGNFFLSIGSFFQRTPSKLMIQTIEPSLVYGIHHNDLMKLADEQHEVETLLRKMVTRSLILSQERMDSIQFETAQQRYEKLITESPGIVQRVPLSFIASFLGVTLETLSRIRAGK